MVHQPKRNTRISHTMPSAGARSSDNAMADDQEVVSDAEELAPTSRAARLKLDDPAVALVRGSEAFDLDHYCAQLGRKLPLDEAVHHYLSEGEAKGLTPNPDFDPDFYLRSYADVAAAGVNAYAHFLRSGRRERRYPSAAALATDAEAITLRDAFDAEYYRSIHPGVAFTRMKPLEHYLTIGCRRGRRPLPQFDGDFYERHYPDVRDSELIPLLHWVEEGRDRGYRTSGAQVEEDVEAVRRSALFDAEFYARGHALTDDEDPALHYVLHGSRLWLDPSTRFSTEYYLRRYPDLLTAGVNPLVHYEQYGKNEGRRGSPPAYRSVFSRGRARLDLQRPTLLVVLHEASRTGAPLLGLALAREWSERWNVIVWAGKQGVLADDLADWSVLAGFGFSDPLDNEFILRDLLREYALDGVVANSVETTPVHPALLACDVPSVGLIHEFASYSRPMGKVTDVLSRLDRCVVPAELVGASAQDELLSITGCTADNVVVRPQGLLPEEMWAESRFSASDDELGMREQMQRRLAGRRIVLGAGFVHIRKGLDLFVETARWVRELTDEPVHFLWIGDGWAPKTDFNLGLWVDDSLERWGLRDDVTIIAAQNSIDWAFDLADVFFLSSRLDPFPNVAIDAMAADVRVVCFDHATGVADFLRRTGAAGEVAPYLDSRAAAEAIVRQLSTPTGEVDNSQVLADELDFGDYVQFIEDQLVLARDSVEHRMEQVDALEDSGCFDRAFHDWRWKSFPDDRRALKEYVAAASKGIFRYGSRAGFHDGAWAAENEAMPGVAPLLAAVRDVEADVLPATHECLLVDATAGPERLDLSIALHVHLFYADLVTELAEALSASGLAADLFVSCGGDVQAKEIDFHLRRYDLGEVNIRVVPNAGRDIGPFLTEFGEEFRTGGYDLLGHLHGKRSVGIGTGDAWRRYLWDHLLSGPGSWDAIASAFGDDPSLGLVFAEDHHLVGWAKNRPHGERLRARLGLSASLPQAPVFPLGTMFWARPEALRPLLDAELTWDEYPSEPLPYDGSMLHAVERLLPTICEETGHRWKTVYIPGRTW